MANFEKKKKLKGKKRLSLVVMGCSEAEEAPEACYLRRHKFSLK